MSRLSILFAIPTLDHGGPDRVFFELLRNLDRTAFRPLLMVGRAEGRYMARLPRDVEVHRIEPQPTKNYPVWTAWRTVRAIRPDVVVATLRMQLTLGLAAPLFPPHTALVLRPATPHSIDFAALIERAPIKHRVSRWLAARTLRIADAAICQTNEIRDDLQGIVRPGVPLFVVPNPIDVAEVRSRARRDHARLRGSPALVSVGRFWHVKGYDILLDALPEVRDCHPDVHLTIFGDGPDRGELERRAQHNGISECVTFAGFDPDPFPAVMSADLFVLASRYEGISNAALESLACGTPVVLTGASDGNVELVREGVNGRIAARPEPKEVATALLRALTEHPPYDREQIAADIDTRYGARRVTAAYEAAFKAAAARKRRSAPAR